MLDRLHERTDNDHRRRISFRRRRGSGRYCLFSMRMDERPMNGGRQTLATDAQRSVYVCSRRSRGSERWGRKEFLVQGVRMSERKDSETFHVPPLMPERTIRMPNESGWRRRRLRLCNRMPVIHLLNHCITTKRELYATLLLSKFQFRQHISVIKVTTVVA